MILVTNVAGAPVQKLQIEVPHLFDHNFKTDGAFEGTLARFLHFFVDFYRLLNRVTHERNQIKWLVSNVSVEVDQVIVPDLNVHMLFH